jgi:hypothetical protein
VTSTSRKLRIGSALTLAGVLVLGTAGTPAAADNHQRTKTATVSILHAIPTGVGAVDVFANQRKIGKDLSPGQLRTVRVPAGKYDLVVVPSGLGGASPALLSASDVALPAGEDLTVSVNLDARGKAALNVFSNTTRTVGQGMGRLTIRHLAAAPALQVTSKGSKMFDRLTNGNQVDIGLRAGTYPLRMSESGARSPVMAQATAKIRNKPGRSDMGNNVIVYIWGDQRNGGLRTSLQEIQLDLT